MDLLRAGLWIVGILVALCLFSGLRVSQESKRAVVACDTMLRDATHLVHAAQQDKNPVFALMHSTEALAFSRALSMLGRDESLERRYSLTSHEMLDRARFEQTEALRRLHVASPGLLPEDATSIAAGYVASAEK